MLVEWNLQDDIWDGLIKMSCKIHFQSAFSLKFYLLQKFKLWGDEQLSILITQSGKNFLY